MYVRLLISCIALVTFAVGQTDSVFAQQGSGSTSKTGSQQKGSAQKGSAQKGSAQKGSGDKGSGSANKGGSSAKTSPALKDPSLATLTSPETFKAKFTTTKGDFVIEVNRAYAPNGADRFYNMVQSGYMNDIAIFRAVENFMFQFGIHGEPAIAQAWGNSTIKDDPFVGISNAPGTISFAQTSRPNSRSSQMFINLGDNKFLDTQRTPFVPFGKVISGLEVVKKINTEYGENPRNENIQGNFRNQGNGYIRKRFPNIDFIKSVTVVE